MRQLQWWAESAPHGWNRVRVFENLGATAVAPVAPADTSLKHTQITSNDSILNFYFITVISFNLQFIKFYQYIIIAMYWMQKFRIVEDSFLEYFLGEV